MNRPSNFVRDLGSPKNGYWHYDNSGNPANGQPDTYKGTNWLTTNSLNDWGGVNGNCGVPNHFFSCYQKVAVALTITVIVIQYWVLVQIRRLKLLLLPLQTNCKLAVNLRMQGQHVFQLREIFLVNAPLRFDKLRMLGLQLVLASQHNASMQG